MFCHGRSASQRHRNLPSKISKDACGCDAGSPLPTHRDLPSEQTASLLIATRTEMSASLEHVGLPAQGVCSLWAGFFRSQILQESTCIWRFLQELVVLTKGLAGLAGGPLVHQWEGCPGGSCVLNSANPRGRSECTAPSASATLHRSRCSQLTGPLVFLVDLQTHCGTVKYVSHFLNYG